MSLPLFDTHTHFDVADFDTDRQHLAEQAKRVGVDALVLIGFLESRFDALIQTHQQLKSCRSEYDRQSLSAMDCHCSRNPLL